MGILPFHFAFPVRTIDGGIRANRNLMKKNLVVFLLIITSACAQVQTAKIRTAGGPTMDQIQAEKYNGPKARIAVVRFVDKSAKGAHEVGQGMADMLTTTLFQTNRFIVLDRQDLDAVINEQDFAAAGRVSEETAAKIGEIEGADLLIFGAVTEFEPEKIGVGGLLMGAVTLGASIIVATQNRDAPVGLITYRESHVALDIKIVDATSGRVVHSGSVEGKNINYGGGIAGAVGGGWSRTPVYMGGFAGTGVAEAVRKCLDAAIGNIVANTPAEYLRVEDTLDNSTTAGQLSPFYPVKIAGTPTAKGVLEKGAQVIDSEVEYKELMAALSAPYGAVSEYDWSKVSLLAVFSGPKEDRSHIIGVTKIIQREKTVEVIVRETKGVMPQEESERIKKGETPQPGYPFDLVRINKPDKEVTFIWER